MAGPYKFPYGSGVTQPTIGYVPKTPGYGQSSKATALVGTVTSTLCFIGGQPRILTLFTPV